MNHYVGRSNNFERRFKDYIDEATKQIKGVLLRLNFKQSEVLENMKILEQFFMDLMEKIKVSLKNKKTEVGKNGFHAALREAVNGLKYCKESIIMR